MVCLYDLYSFPSTNQPTTAAPATYGTLGDDPGYNAAHRTLLIFVALANITASYTASKVIVEIQAGIKAAPQPTNIPRTNKSMLICLVMITLIYLGVAAAGFVSTGGQCENVLQCMTLSPAISV